MLDGVLDALEVEAAAEAGGAARYRLALAAAEHDPGAKSERFLDMNTILNSGLEIIFNERVTCCACGADTRKSYADGFCYGCFRRLARCDLCVVEPVRCHFAQGTCREPEWGERFCMQPHLVYLANSSGAKVGITTCRPAGAALARSGRRPRGWWWQRRPPGTWRAW